MRDRDTTNKIIAEDVVVSNNISKAACYIEDAIDGRLANGKGKMSTASKTIQLCFYVQTHEWWNNFIYFSIIAFSALILFEPPSSVAILFCKQGWLYNGVGSGKACSDTKVITPWEAWTVCIELLIILILMFDVAMKATYMKPSVYVTKKHNKINMFLILMFSLDWIFFLTSNYIIDVNGIRFSRPFRMLLLLRQRDLRRIFETITEMIQQLIKILTTIMFFVLIFAGLGVTLYGKLYQFTNECTVARFGDKAKDCVNDICWDQQKYWYCVCDGSEGTEGTKCDNDQYTYADPYLPSDMDIFNGTFHNPIMAFVRLMVVLSTENYPSVILPAYKEEKYYFLYFFLLIFVGMFLLLSVLLVNIVEFWLGYLTKTTDNEKKKERLGITKAFTWISLQDPKKKGYISEATWNELILLLKPNSNKIQSHFMFNMLDYSQNSQLDVLDFLNITEALKMHYSLKDADTAIENTEIGQFCRRILSYYITVRGKDLTFKTARFVTTIVHVVLNVIYWVDAPSLFLIMRQAVVSIIMIFLLFELLLRLMANGSSFLRPMINKLEVSTVCIGFVCMIGYWITWVPLKDKSASLSPQDYFRFTWEMMMYLKMLALSNTMRGQTLFLWKVMLVIIDVFCFIVMFCYLFLGIGLEIFAIASDYTDSPSENNYFHYYDCKIGFTSTWCGVMTLWQLITTSNWHDVMNLTESNTGWWAYIYFVAFYIMIGLVLLDLMVAISIEMYRAVKENAIKTNEDEEYVDQPGLSFEVYEYKKANNFRSPEIHDPRRRRSRLDSIFKAMSPNPTRSHEQHHKFILEVTRSNKGTWRESIASTDLFDIDSKVLDKMQTDMMKDYKVQGLTPEDTVPDVHHLYQDKTAERARIEKPEVKLYIETKLLNKHGDSMGVMLSEIQEITGLLTFKVKVKTSSPIREAIFRKSDAESCEDIYKVPAVHFKYDEKNEQWSTFQLWNMERCDKKSLFQEIVSFIIVTEKSPYGECHAELNNIVKEKSLWEVRRNVVKQDAEQFAKISPLLKWFAHRCEARQLQDEESEDEGGVASGERLGVKKKTVNRTVYVPNEYNKTKFKNEAHRKWVEAFSKDVGNVTKDETVKNTLNFLSNLDNMSNSVSTCSSSSDSDSDDSNDYSAKEEQEKNMPKATLKHLFSSMARRTPSFRRKSPAKSRSRSPAKKDSAIDLPQINISRSPSPTASTRKLPSPPAKRSSSSPQDLELPASPAPPAVTPWTPTSVKRPVLEKKEIEVLVPSPSPDGYFHPNSDPPPDINIESGEGDLENGVHLV